MLFVVKTHEKFRRQRSQPPAYCLVHALSSCKLKAGREAPKSQLPRTRDGGHTLWYGPSDKAKFGQEEKISSTDPRDWKRTTVVISSPQTTLRENNMCATRDQRLYSSEELPALLRLNQEQVDRLVRTGQLRPIRICGEVRFDSNELDALIETYKQIATRKTHARFHS